MKNKILLILFVINFSCTDIFVTDPEMNLNTADFESVWNRVNSVYPLLEFKKINWDSLHNVYRTRVENSKGDEFYFVLSDLLSELKDGHAYYKTEGGAKVYPYYPERHFRDRHAYSPFVVRKYFDKELIVSESGSIEYGILPGNIGYIFLSDFHEDYLINEFPVALNYLKNTKGLIIDIRQKRGGGYDNVEAVITRFISTPLKRPDLYFLGQLLDIPDFQPQSSLVYLKPVVVIVNGSTFSAGEITTEIMKQIPTVTVIGDTTGGGGVSSSGHLPETIGEYILPSGKAVYIGTGYFKKYDGNPVEWLGVIPDIRVIQTEADVKTGRDKQLEYAINLLK